ncbi:MAG: histidine kinase [Tepidanaerobacteraceae bacterium]|jgi:hypothetical protein
MISKDLITLVIIFTIILAIGVSVAETRVNSSLGLDVRPKSISFFVDKKRNYEICLLGRRYEFESLIKIGEIHAGKEFINIQVADKRIFLPHLIKTGLNLKEWLNLD